MGLSKRAKRGISMLSHIQWKTKNWKYHVPAPTMISVDPNALPQSVLQAGVDAISKMRENANAIQKLSDSQANPVPNGEETRTADSLRVQQKDGPQSAEGPAAGPSDSGNQ